MVDRDNDETTAVTTRQPDAMTAIASSREAQEVQAMMIAAKRFPRDCIKAREAILNSCQREGLARSALYSYSRGGSDISGPSIRLAEEMARQWGNLQYGIRELEQGENESTVEAYCWDMESNARSAKTFHVPHVRHTKKGAYTLKDPRDIYENVANNGARRLRACILAVIPGDITEDAVDQCEQTLVSKADVSPAGIKKAVDAFAAIGVTKEQIEKRIQRRIDAMTPAQKVSLHKIYTSIKDGMSAAFDWFGEAQPDIKMPKAKADPKAPQNTTPAQEQAEPAAAASNV